MPRAPNKPCRAPGCSRTVDGGGYCSYHTTECRNPCYYKGCSRVLPPGQWYCKPHQRLIQMELSTEIKETKRFYSRSQWQKLRKLQLSRQPVCQGCGKLANVVDHITPINEGGDPIAFGNLQSLCSSCHNTKTMKETMAKRRRKEDDGVV